MNRQCIVSASIKCSVGLMISSMMLFIFDYDRTYANEIAMLLFFSWIMCMVAFLVNGNPYNVDN